MKTTRDHFVWIDHSSLAGDEFYAEVDRAERQEVDEIVPRRRKSFRTALAEYSFYHFFCREDARPRLFCSVLILCDRPFSFALSSTPFSSHSTLSLFDSSFVILLITLYRGRRVKDAILPQEILPPKRRGGDESTRFQNVAPQFKAVLNKVTEPWNDDFASYPIGFYQILRDHAEEYRKNRCPDVLAAEFDDFRDFVRPPLAFLSFHFDSLLTWILQETVTSEELREWLRLREEMTLKAWDTMIRKLKARAPTSAQLRTLRDQTYWPSTIPLSALELISPFSSHF